jgi:hypothetical protein
MSLEYPRLEDPDLPSVGVLLGPDARGLLEALVPDVQDFRMRQVSWWPGRRITVRYQVTSQKRIPPIVASAGVIPDGAAIVEANGARVGLWSLPDDPALPGLASALDPSSVRAMLADIGIFTARVAIDLRAYRPTRRAVVQVDTETVRIYLKLGRPRSVARLHETHRMMASTLPVPRSLGYDADLGILMMPSGRGRTLRDTLDTGSGALPSAGELSDLLAAIPLPLDKSGSRSPIDKLGSLRLLLDAIGPDQRSRIDDLVGRIGTEEPGEQVPAHGDFHDGQVLIEDGRISGLLDIDTHGMGHPADDLSTMIGHLVSRRPHAQSPERIEAFTDELMKHWTDRVDRGEIKRRQAAVMLGLATGPFRVQQEGWPGLVRQRIIRAEQSLD